MYTNDNVTIRSIEEKDLLPLWELMYGVASPEWKKWDAPYFEHKQIPKQAFLAHKGQYIDQDDRWVILVEDKVVGTVGYYWEHKPSNWLEMGIGIYDPTYWNGGYGTKALVMWINHLFNTLPLVRVGYTTWSGNERMIKVGEKLGMTMEARLRKCRYYNGTYYDSIRMGLLREEWEESMLITNE
ncbi:GNAT family N-acetyltransferase [Aquibacillus koreensis]|uniref:GNAT family N-acetyltransferase n=1 Tax=Aquibacillus koreensis TaxID=279446 RepID=A0A9X3WKI8_9BACI|nr:GNAT family protein [Aquibacillus koreensis]MCT2535847.1 GNAT family N-acetyltransferase [Aquibacillus koreensis]MDC3420303.1 GNAT family N-acetyltransferase [Aquibacillus koreensis]